MGEYTVVREEDCASALTPTYHVTWTTLQVQVSFEATFSQQSAFCFPLELLQLSFSLLFELEVISGPLPLIQEAVNLRL